MRVRILKPVAGVMEGRSLSDLRPGFIYEVDNFVGVQLVELNAAIEVRSTDPVLAMPEDDKADIERMAKGVVVIAPEKADDRSERRRGPRRGKVDST